MSKLEVDAIEPQSGTTITIGASGDTVNLVGTLQSNGSPLPGDISEVVAGTGLSGGGTTGAVTINIESAQPTITSLGTLSSATISGDVTVDTSTLKVDSSNDRVGIGTASPSSLLHIFSSEPTLIIQDGGAYSVNATPSISLRDGSGAMGSINYSSGGIFRINQAKNDHLTFSTNNTERFRIRSDGIGCFGTTSASGVAGTGVSIRSGVVGSSGVATLNLAGSGVDFFALRFASSGFQIADIVSSSVDHLSIRNSSNETTLATFNDGTTFIKKDLGVGTSSPNATIHGYTSDSGVSPNTNADELFVEASGNSGITIGSGTTGAGILAFGDSDDNDRGEIAYLHDVDALRFTTAAAERVRINNSGNVGIGTSDPKEKLDSRGSAVFSGDHATSANAYATAHGVMINSVSGVGKMTAISNGANDVDLELRALDGGSALANQLYLKGSSGRVGVNTNNPSRTFTVSGQLMTTQSASGTVGTPNLEINGGGYSAFHFLDTAAYFIGQNSQNRNLRMFSGNNSGVGVQLSPQGTSFGSYSDERLKKDITDLTNGLDKISAMRPVNFKYKTDADDYRNRIGIIAQSLIGQVDEALDLTKKDADDETKYYNVRYQDLIPVLVKGMQEQQTKIEELEARITQLENA